MCGIAGIFRPGGAPADWEAALASMREPLTPRGPDGSGAWSDPVSGIALAHTRLAILDLSPRGAQPMLDAGGRGAISYNGEVYNFRELRRELEGQGVRFSSATDTEVVLQACLRWGVAGALPRMNGMFAFALWVSSERALYLVRDRMGVKPLYHGRAGEELLFASTLSALRAHPRFSPALDPESLPRYLMLRYVPGPATIYRAARRLPPGHFLRATAGGEELVRWWDPPAAPVEGRGEGEGKGPRTLAQAGEELEALLADSIRLRLVADVPLGVFLSGGADSALVAALMCREGVSPLRTFTIGYDGGEFDESAPAAAVARALGAEHHPLVVRAHDLPGHLADLADLFDDPLSDPSALPLALLARHARGTVKVALSGDGADELMGGYDRYRFFRGSGGRLLALPRPLRAALAAALALAPVRATAPLYRGLRPLLRESRRVNNFAGKWGKGLSLLAQVAAGDIYLGAVGVFSRAEAAALLGRSVELPPPFAPPLFLPRPGSARELMELDQQTFLPDDVLTKIDRAGMASGLEIRDPLLDHRIVGWARDVPERLLFADGRGKAPLREVAARLVPSCDTARPKTGFTLPLDEWFRGPLLPLLRERLGEKAVAREGLFDPRAVARLLAEHRSGRADHSERLWNLLFFSLWRERWNPALA